MRPARRVASTILEDSWASKMRAESVTNLGLVGICLPDEMNLLGFDFHRLHGKPVRYSVHVNGPWCITFEFEEGDAYRVDYEQYH